MKIIPGVKVQDSGSFKRATPAGQWNSVGNWEVVDPDVPRFSYDPMDLTKPPILVLENEATNLIKAACRFDTVAWVWTWIEALPNTEMAPNGLMEATKLVARPFFQAHYLEQYPEINGAKTYTRSIYVKAGEYPKLRIDIYGRGSNWERTPGRATITFDANTGELSNPILEGKAVHKLSKEKLPNGWWRVIQTFNLNDPQATMCFCRTLMLQGENTNATFMGDSTSGIYVWNDQLEIGDKASSPIASQATLTSRGTNGAYWDEDMTLKYAPAEVPRMTYNPLYPSAPPYLLLEWGSTNFIRNNTMSGAQMNTVTLPAYWIPSTNVPTLVREVVGLGKDDGIDYIDIRVSGAVGAFALPEYTFQFDSNTTISAAYNSLWSSSVYAKLVSGTVDLVAGLEHYIIAYKADGTSLSVAKSVVTQPATSDLKLNRLYNSQVLDGPDTAYVASRLDLNFKSGGGYNVDVTIRIGLPQLEANFASTPIRTDGGGILPQRWSEFASYQQKRAADTTDIGLISLLPENDAGVYSPSKAYAIGDKMIEVADHKVYESGLGTRYSTASVTSNQPSFITIPNHPFKIGDSIVFEDLPLPNTAMTLQTEYFVVSVNAGNGSTIPAYFDVSATKGGAPITPNAGAVTLGPLVHNGNFGRAAPDKDRWLDTGSTNKWAFLDQSIESQTLSQDVFCAGIRTPTGELIDSVVIQNIEGAAQVRVALITMDEGVVYDRVINMSTVGNILDPYQYTFEPIDRDTDLVLSGLPPYAGAYVSVTMLGPGEIVKAGLVVIGRSKNFGPTQAGMSLGMLDYSKKEKNDYGNTEVKEGAFSGTMNLTCFVDRAKMNQLIKMLIGLRATPAVYIGDDTLTCSVKYGYYNDYTMGADYVEHSVLHIAIESLT